VTPIPKRNKRKSWRRGIIPARDHLYVVTTNLDAQRTAIWDMGKICCQRRRGDIFVPVLSLVAVVVTAVVNCAPDEWLTRRWRSRALCCQAAPASKQS